MRLIKTLLLMAWVVFTFASCAKIFYSKDAYQLAHQQKKIAIVPPTVTIAPNKKIDAEMMREQQRAESLNFQQEMYSWMLKRVMQGKITQEIQELETTNVMLKKAGYPETPLTSEEICEVLGVDGIMTSSYHLAKPISEGVAIAAAVLTGIMGSTNDVRVSLDIHDCSNKKMIWNYDHIFSGGIGSSPTRLVDELMRQASKKMPYMYEK
ncbi:MAG TPA: hypothetical protein VFG54_11935 [Prolixibacteraceae bacterium]|nr:hypothetical protein [Prolixibacteraceae bacterium]